MDEEIVVHPYNGLNSRKDWAIETHENMDEFQRKSPDYKRLNTI